MLPQPYDMEMGAGNSDLCEVALALQCLYDVPVEMNLTEARRVSALVQQAGQYKVDRWRPVVGDNLFIRESGAVASQFRLPESRHAELLARVKEKSTAAKRLITDEEFRQLAGAAIRAQG